MVSIATPLILWGVFWWVLGFFLTYLTSWLSKQYFYSLHSTSNCGGRYQKTNHKVQKYPTGKKAHENAPGSHGMCFKILQWTKTLDCATHFNRTREESTEIHGFYSQNRVWNPFFHASPNIGIHSLSSRRKAWKISKNQFFRSVAWTACVEFVNTSTFCETLFVVFVGIPMIAYIFWLLHSQTSSCKV